MKERVGEEGKGGKRKHTRGKALRGRVSWFMRSGGFLCARNLTLDVVRRTSDLRNEVRIGKYLIYPKVE